jgi:hypothetical protein
LQSSFEEKYGPAMATVEREENLRVLEERVPGFRKHLPEIKEVFQSMSPEDQAEYDTRIGLEAIARMVIRDGGSGDLSSMAHSADPHQSPPPPQNMNPTEDDVWSMDDDQFEAYVHSIKMGGPR